LIHGVYIHVPFCRQKCDYCSFYSVPCLGLGTPEREGLFARYLSVLKGEIASRQEYHGLPVDTVFFGGGTPSFAGASFINGVLDEMRRCFVLEADAEISVECNPGDLDSAFLRELREGGVNRVTVGVQAFDEDLRKRIGRRVSMGGAGSLEAFLETPGFVHGLDIIAGIPGAGDAEVLHELEAAAALRPEHVSAYMLALEEGTPLAKRMIMDDASSEDQRRHFAMTTDFLGSRGYRHYEISNFCLPGCESRHNMKYWTFQPYLGFGVRAHGFTGGRRYYNEQSLDEYLSGPVIREDIRDTGGVMAEFIMTALRLIDGFTAGAFRSVLGEALPDAVKRRFDGLESKGMITIADTAGDTRYRLTREGLFFADSVIYTAVEPLL